MKIKKELLEHLVRSCVREVISQVREVGDETEGVPAPPADGTGAGENLGIPKEKDTTPEPASEPETPPTQESPKGICFVNPRKTSELIKLFQEPMAPSPKKKPGRKPRTTAAPAPSTTPTPPGPPTATPVTEAVSPVAAYSHIPPKQLTPDMVERVIYYMASKFAGARVKVANSTLREVDKAIKSGSTLFLYIGKFDETSDEIFVLSDSSLQAAKSSSLPSVELGGSMAQPTPDGADEFDPNTASAEDVARYMDKDAPGKVRSYGVPDEPDDLGDVEERKLNEVKLLIKRLVNEVLNK